MPGKIEVFPASAKKVIIHELTSLVFSAQNRVTAFVTHVTINTISPIALSMRYRASNLYQGIT